MTSEIPPRTVDEYLQVSDWHFEVDIQQGTHSGFSWLRSEMLARSDISDLISLPERPFSVLVTFWDWHGGAAKVYGTDAGWRQLGDYAISSPSRILPKLHFGADNTQMFLDDPIPDHDILAALIGFDDPYDLDDLDSSETRKFWNCIEMINPYCYFSYAREFTLITRGRDLLDQALTQVSIEELEAHLKHEAAANRARLWDSLGPECGPEECVVPACGRLRIRLAVRCFMHQLDWGGSLDD